uniref:Venom cystatin-like protein 3 n=1 Tax=Pristhesancus plagipennis TaxID=1955184 RepID=A0A1Q1NP98_PRIPG|nr:venom cystatin-like protein 3 [Pristhesancus plagipennis]
MSLLTVTVSALLVLTIAVLNSAEAGACLGCFNEISVDDKNLKKTLNMALNLANAGNYKVIKILKAEEQVVAGFKYRIKFAAKIPGKGKKICRLSCVHLLNEPLRVEGLSCK